MLWKIEDPDVKWKRLLVKSEPEWRRLSEWHSWFAWFPVRVSPTERAWLITVERRLDAFWRIAQLASYTTASLTVSFEYRKKPLDSKTKISK
jgi:hypothetical protein